MHDMFAKYIRTDLAAEQYSVLETEYAKENRGIPDGIAYTSYRSGCIFCEEVEICNEKGAALFGKPIGSYLTLYPEALDGLSREEMQRKVQTLAVTLRKVAHKTAPHAKRILVCGLGNRLLTADAIGPLTVDRLPATQHLAQEPEELYAPALLSVLAPGVVAQTGIETSALIQGAVRACNPALVIVIDALAARESKRLFRTIQLSNRGLAPGGGVGNTRRAVDQDSIGVPVMSVGVPTVIDTATLLYDTLSAAKFSAASLEKENLTHLEDAFNQSQNLFITPKDGDRLARLFSIFLAKGLTEAFSGACIKELSTDLWV